MSITILGITYFFYRVFYYQFFKNNKQKVSLRETFPIVESLEPIDITHITLLSFQYVYFYIIYFFFPNLIFPGYPLFIPLLIVGVFLTITNLIFGYQK